MSETLESFETEKPHTIESLFFVRMDTSGWSTVASSQLSGSLTDASAPATWEGHHGPYAEAGQPLRYIEQPGTPEHAAIMVYLAAVAQLVEAIPGLVVRRDRTEDAA